MRRADLLSRVLQRDRLVAGAILLQWLTMLWVWYRADGVDLDRAVLLTALFLVPLALYSAFDLAAHLGGVALGGWTLLVWVAVPWLAPLFTLASYDTTLRDDVLPLLVGLTSQRQYLEGVALLAVLVALISLRPRTRLAVGAGGIVLAGLVALWLSRLPVPDLSRDAFEGAMAGLREYFWSQRVLQWLPLAGVIAVVRRSVPAAVALGAWLGGYVAIRAAHPGNGYENGELFRELLPAYPAYVLLAAALPLLVPTLAARLGPLARPRGS